MERLDYKWKFNEEIKKRSPDATTLNDALTQWKVLSKERGLDNCICTYPNIKRLNIVENIITNELIIVGECCVNKFKIQDINIRCCECQRPLHITNKYVDKLYKSGVCLDENISIIGHKKCADKINVIYNQLIEKTPLKSNLKQELSKYFVNHFGGIIKYATINSSREVEIEYEDKYDKYLQLLNIIST